MITMTALEYLKTFNKHMDVKNLPENFLTVEDLIDWLKERNELLAEKAISGYAEIEQSARVKELEDAPSITINFAGMKQEDAEKVLAKPTQADWDWLSSQQNTNVHHKKTRKNFLSEELEDMFGDGAEEIIAAFEDGKDLKCTQENARM